MMVRCLAMMRGGGETRHLAWAHELRTLGVEVDIITGEPLLFGRARYRTEGVPTTTVRSPYTRDFVYRFQNRRGFGRLTMHTLHADEEIFCRAAWRKIAAREKPPDVVHAHALYQAARLRCGDVPVVINLPGEPHGRYAEDLRRADALIADGWAASNLPALLGRPVERVPKGVDSERFAPEGVSAREPLRLADRRVVLTVARLVPIKNVSLLLDAFAIVRDRVPHAHLVVVGEGPEAATLRHRAAAPDLASAVTFVGYVPQSDTPPYYRAADVFALSSDFDNSPNVVLEAMACGLPVVATDAGGVREFVSDRLGGLIVRRHDAEALAAALQTYLMSPDARRSAGDYNRMRATTEFSWHASAVRLHDVYHRVVEARAAA